MKLNPDCIRDILLEVECVTNFDRCLTYDKNGSMPKRWSKYDHDEIIYHIRQCELSDLILDVLYADAGDHIQIEDLSPAGHEFLANIRQDNIWNNTKEVAAKIGSKSLNALIQISSSVITELIKTHFNLA